MLSIFKYVLKAETHQTVSIPIGGKLLSAQEQHENIVLYALVDPNEKTISQQHQVYVFGTGHDVPEDIEQYTFLNTVKMEGGSLMFHVFVNSN